MRVRITRKLADMIDGVDIRAYTPGDVVDVPPEDARLLIAEAWAIEERRSRDEKPGVDRRQSDARHFERAG
jgi:hypothetical protein